MTAEQKLAELKDLLSVLYEKERKLKHEWYYIEIGDKDIILSNHFQNYIEKQLNFVII